MARRIWSNPENPPSQIARQLGITHEQLRDRLHKLKRWAGLRPGDHINIFDDGTITDDVGDPIGNVCDEI